ncbi:MFS transporter [Amycolatopsis jejuensis]|uniref:MFS transporter n=1 Tax=Amycolatopsis jejuensis TaxID=330084 RepID=UPI000AB5763D|nr:MFS transporter [Amycolatopsis jejuensis]
MAGFAALLLGMLLAQLDTNIVVAALPSIGSDLHTGAIAGVTAAYLLTVTVTTPLAGKLGDVLGRRAVFTASVLVFGAGSLACAASGSMLTLILARAVQGVGGAGLIVTAVSTMGVLFDKTELVRRQIWLSAATAVSALAGPPVGGFVSAAWGWPSIFLINVPVCLVALMLGLRGLPAGEGVSSLRGFDVLGTVLIAVVASSIVLLGSFEQLANSPAWASVLAGAAAAGTWWFVRCERRAANPLIPPGLFASRGLARSIVATGLSGIALFGTFTFIPLAVIAGTGYDAATVSGMLVALTGGQLAVTITFSIVARRYPRMVPWGRLGLGMGVAGLGLLATLPFQPGIAALLGLALSGAALGLSMQAYPLLGIACAPPEHFGSAMATVTFARQLGGSLGAAVFGWLVIVLQTPAVALGAAAVVLLVALVAAPRKRDELQPVGRPAPA